MRTVSLDEDFHVHSRFSDGNDMPADNVAAATTRGLRRLGCVDHVRRDSTFVPDFVAAIRALRLETTIELTIGVEARILDADGALDLPPSINGVELVFAADHQVPRVLGPVSPYDVRCHVESTAGADRDVIEQIVSAAIATMRRASGQPYGLVLAHLFSVLPKLGIDEATVPDSAIDRIVEAAADTGTIIEVSERWRCPEPRVIMAALRRGVRVVASTDSHKARAVGRYYYVADLVASLRSWELDRIAV